VAFEGSQPQFAHRENDIMLRARIRDLYWRHTRNVEPHMRTLSLCILLVMATSTAAQGYQPPDRIRVRGENRDPEGERFLLSSMAEGTVYEISYDGTTTLFVEDQELTASLGLEIDTANNRLLVVNADFEHSENAYLGIYDFTTGERLRMVDLGALAPDHPHVPNDVALDSDGIAYVTDSLAPVIYQVDMDGNASILLEDERLLIEGFGGNGIVYHPDHYLLVGISGVELYKIPLDTPQDLTIVDTS
jgi:hypothetical protein